MRGIAPRSQILPRPCGKMLQVLPNSPSFCPHSGMTLGSSDEGLWMRDEKRTKSRASPDCTEFGQVNSNPGYYSYSFMTGEIAFYKAVGKPANFSHLMNPRKFVPKSLTRSFDPQQAYLGRVWRRGPSSVCDGGTSRGAAAAMCALSNLRTAGQKRVCNVPEKL